MDYTDISEHATETADDTAEIVARTTGLVDDVVLGAQGQSDVVRAPAPRAFAHCDDCGVPVEQLQRYCVNCGARRRAVRDPASRYFAQASARGRAGAPPAVRPRTISRGAVALVLTLILIAAGVGILVGRTSGNGDAHLIQTLNRQIARQRAELTGSAAKRSGAGATGTSTSRGTTTTTKGKSEAQGIQRSTGSSYENKSLNLPSSVEVP